MQEVRMRELTVVDQPVFINCVRAMSYVFITNRIILERPKLFCQPSLGCRYKFRQVLIHFVKTKAPISVVIGHWNSNLRAILRNSQP